jgi:ABC-type phosphate transport system substrate-binding protein
MRRRPDAVVALLALTLGTCIIGAPARTRAAVPRHILVVVSAANRIEPLPAGRMRRIFLREVTVWSNGWPITVFERPTDHPIRAAFSSSVLGKTPAQLSEYWLSVALTRGLEPPKVCRTSALLRQYFERVKGGIGYVWEDEMESGMLEVGRFVPASTP